MASSPCYILQLNVPIKFYPQRNHLVIDEQEVHIEPLQARLLSYLIDCKGQVVSTQKIAESVWQRSHVSDNLVRQVISQLRSHLQDTSRPYQVIKTIPKQGYLFDIKVTQESEPTPDASVEGLEISNASIKVPAKNKRGIYLALASICLAVLATLLLVTNKQIQLNTNPAEIQAQTIPVYIHELTLDSSQDYTMAESVFNYLFYGLNSARSITGYHFSQLAQQDQENLVRQGVEIKGWIKHVEQDYLLTLIVQNHQHPELNHKIEQTFNESSFFDAIGDVVLEVKAVVAPNTADYQEANHRVTSIDNFDDWKAISAGISLFYQGKGGEAFKPITQQLQQIQQQGRDNYLVNALLSYAASLDYLEGQKQKSQSQSLVLAKQAFEMNPRCDIANLTLGLALLINNQHDQSYPYLFYAAESTPSPISYYLLSVTEQSANNPKSSQYNYQRFEGLQKENKGQLFDLIESSQKANLF